MGKYTDDEICNAAKITIKIAADYLSISPNILTLGMRNNLLPIGYAVHNEDRYRDSWTYAIIPERLIAYQHSKINEVQVEAIEKSLNTIIAQFDEMKQDWKNHIIHGIGDTKLTHILQKNFRSNGRAYGIIPIKNKTGSALISHRSRFYTDGFYANPKPHFILRHTGISYSSVSGDCMKK